MSGLHPESRPNKRARTNTNTAARTNAKTSNTSTETSTPGTMSMEELRPLLPSLGPEKILALLTRAAETTPSVRTLIHSAITAKRLEESRRVINFDWHSIRSDVASKGRTSLSESGGGLNPLLEHDITLGKLA
ncbi:hypothetical protein BJY00DRAFT_319756 [Aspergillus carlsbadensis]|nr:hypothetical protein BJY00DRAFT_319756 [Aspergillus carlsbadensis]